MAKDIYFNDPRNQKPAVTYKTKSPAASYTEQLKQPIPEPDKPNAGKHKSIKKKRKKHPLRAVLCLLLVLLTAVGGIGVWAVSTVLTGYTPETLEDNAYTEESELKHSAGVYNVLLMGVDTMETGSNTRSDAMILMSVDTLHKCIKLTSFMRDMYVTVPGHGDTKLTHACQYAGPQLTVDTIEYNFGIKIDAYAKIGYDILIELVDGVGGVTVSEIDETEAYALSLEGVDKTPGTDIYLTGAEALQYCRIRRGQSDFQRTERQREMISLVIKKMLKTNPATLIKLAKNIASEIQCSIGKAELYKLAFKVLPCLTGDIKTQQIPADGTWNNGTRDSMSVLLVNFSENRSIIEEFIYG